MTAPPNVPAQRDLRPAGLRMESCGLSVAGRWLMQPQTVALQPGLTAVIGPNGAGKSTLLRLLSGQQRPTTGRVWLDDRPLGAWSVDALARRRALLPQDGAVAFEFTVREVVVLGRYPWRRQPADDEDRIVDAALQQVGLGGIAARAYSSLSGGERARVQFARVLAQLWPTGDTPTRWLLLDEPTAALDLLHQQTLLALVRRMSREHGWGVVAVVHDINLALRHADRALLVAQGRIVDDGPPASVLTPQQVQSVWGVEAEVVLGRDRLPQMLWREPAALA